jgi:hypothetical protein
LLKALPSLGPADVQWVAKNRTELSNSAFIFCLLCNFKLWVRFLLSSAHRHANHFRSVCIKTGETRLISPKFT